MSVWMDLCVDCIKRIINLKNNISLMQCHDAWDVLCLRTWYACICLYMKWCKVYDAEWNKCGRCMQVCSMKWCNECTRRLKHSSRGHYWGDRSQSAGQRHWCWWPFLSWGFGFCPTGLAGDGRDDLSVWCCRPLLGNNWRCRGIGLATDSLGKRG